MKNYMILSAIITALLITLNPSTVHACTSWMIFSDFTKNGTNILHKNRDAHPRKIAVYTSGANSPRKWIGSGNKGGLYMGMNNSGVAIIMNNGESYTNYTPNNTDIKKSVPTTILEGLEKCDTAAQFVALLQDIVRKNHYYHINKRGAIYFVCDRNEGYICEMTSYYCSVQRYDKGYAVRANIWQNPGMYQLSRTTIKSYLNSSARAYIAISELNKLLDTQKKIDQSGIFDLSRHYLMPQDSPQKRSVCFNATNSTASFEIDRQYPDVLSTMYTTIGHPRHTVYVPVPVCVEKIHPAMEDLKWSNAAWKRFDELKLDAPFPADWSKFEKDSMAEYTKAIAEARKLLNANKRAEAVKLINYAAAKIWQDAVKLLKI